MDKVATSLFKSDHRTAFIYTGSYFHPCNSGHLGREVAAEFKLLERHRHGVGAKEEDKGHEGQVRDVLAGLSYQ